MSNQLYQQQFSSNPQNPQNQQNQQNQFGGPTNMVQRFEEFKRNFTGDPKQIVQQMLNSGRISQAQLDQAVQMTNSFAKMMRK